MWKERERWHEARKYSDNIAENEEIMSHKKSAGAGRGDEGFNDKSATVNEWGECSSDMQAFLPEDPSLEDQAG